MTRNVLFGAGATLAATLFPAGASAIPDYGDDFQSTTPKAGWRYLWNAAGALESSPGVLDAGNLTELTASGASYVGTGPSAGSVAATATSLTPGQGTAQGDGIERYVLAAYTITAADLVNGNEGFIDDYSFQIAPQDPVVSDGVNTIVFVNTAAVVVTPIPPLPVPYTPDSPGGFAFPLGTLHENDTVYVAIGAGTTDIGDEFLVDYSIVLVPEPAALGLLGLATMVLAGRRRRTPG